MLQIINSFNNLPLQLDVDPYARFEPGQITGMSMAGFQTVNYRDIIGIIDDIRQPSHYNYVDLIFYPGRYSMGTKSMQYHGQTVTVLDRDSEYYLPQQNIIPWSISLKCDASLPPIVNAKLGLLTFFKGTIFNNNDSIKFSIEYEVFDQKCKDTTCSSGKVTVWNKELIGKTDQFDKNLSYQKGAPLFRSFQGIFSTIRNGPQIGFVERPPLPTDPVLHFHFIPPKDTGIFTKREIVGFSPQKHGFNIIERKDTEEGSYCIDCNAYNEYVNEANWRCYKCTNGY